MPAHDQQEQKRLQRLKELQAKRQRYQHEVDRLRNQLTAAGAHDTQVRSAFQDFPEDLGADREMPVDHESHDSFSDSEQDSFCVVASSTVESSDSTPAAPSEETLRRYATTVAYSSYSRLCGTSDRSLIHQLFENDLQKDPSSIFEPKKMFEVPRTGQNIASLREEIADGASLFSARMIEARRRVDPGLTTHDQVRRLGPADIPGDSLPIYWIVTFSQQGVVDWEEGCSLARAYRRVFEDFCAEDVHCLVFECEKFPSSADAQKSYAIE